MDPYKIQPSTDIKLYFLLQLKHPKKAHLASSLPSSIIAVLGTDLDAALKMGI